jgi:hypothetical protein
MPNVHYKAENVSYLDRIHGVLNVVITYKNKSSTFTRLTVEALMPQLLKESWKLIAGHSNNAVLSKWSLPPICIAIVVFYCFEMNENKCSGIYIRKFLF